MEVKVRLVIQSHLSDAMAEMSVNPEQAAKRLSFVKLLVSIYSDTNTYATEEYLNELYNEAVGSSKSPRFSPVNFS
jgi:radical SAM superfamily enzyme